MKKTFVRYLLSIVLVLSMLASACLPLSALAIVAPSEDSSELPSFSLTYEDGILSLRLNAELLYEVVSDKTITKEELTRFVPTDVLALFENGTPSVADLKSVLLNYLSTDDLKAMIADMPTDVARRLVDVEMIKGLFAIDELMGLVDIEAILSGVDAEALMTLIEGKPLELMLTPEVMDTVINNLDPSVLATLLANDELMNTPAVKAEIERQVGALLSGNQSAAFFNTILSTPGLFEQLFTDDLKTKFFSPALIQQLNADGKLNFAALDASEIKMLKDQSVISLDNIDVKTAATIIGQQKLLAYLGAANMLALAEDFYNRGYLTYSEIKDIPGVINSSPEVAEALKDLLLEREMANLLPNGTVDETTIKTLIDNGTLTIADLIECGVLRTNDPAAQAALKEILAEKALEAYFGNGLNAEQQLNALIEADKISIEDLESHGILRDPSEYSDELMAFFTSASAPDMNTYFPGGTFAAAGLIALVEDGYLSLDTLRTWGAFDTSDAKIGALKDALVARETDRYFVGGVINAAALNALIGNGAGQVTLAELLTALNDSGMLATDATALNALKEHLAQKAIEDYLGGRELNESTLPALLDQLIRDGKISLGDLKNAGALNLNNISMEKALGAVTTAELLAYVSAVKGKTYTEIDVAIDFYSLGYLSFADMETLGVTINTSKLTLSLITSTGIMTEATIKECLTGGTYIQTSALCSALLDDTNRANTMSVIGANISVFKNYIDFKAFAEKVGYANLVNLIGIEPIVNALGGYSNMLSLYDRETLIAIVQAIGTDRIQAFLASPDIQEALDIRGILQKALDLVKSKKGQIKEIISTISNRALAMLAQDFDAIYLNGEMIFSPDEDAVEVEEIGKFDLSQILAILLRGIPDVGDFLALGDNATLASYSIRLMPDAEKYPSAPSNGYGLGFSVGFIGSLEGLQGFVEKYQDLFDIQEITNDLDISVSSTLPATVATVYETLLSSGSGSELNDLLLNMPNMTLTEIAAELALLSDEKIEALAATFAAKTDALRAKLSSALAKAGMLADKIEPKVDAILDKLTTAEGLKALRDTLTEKLLTIVDGDVRTLDSFYNVEEKCFQFYMEQEYNLYEIIGRVVTLPEDIRILFTDHMVLRPSLTLSLGITDLHRLEVIVPGRSASTFSLRAARAYTGMETEIFYLPEGLELSVLGLGEFLDANGNPIHTVSGDSLRVYSDQFYRVTFEFGVDTVAPITIFYAEGTGASAVTALPEIPTEDLPYGFIYEWPYTLDGVHALLDNPASPEVTITISARRPMMTFVNEATNTTIARKEFIPGTDTLAAWEADGILEELLASYDHAWTLVGTMPDMTLAEDQSVSVSYARTHYYVSYRAVNGSLLARVRYQPNVTPDASALPNLEREGYHYTLSAEPDWTKAEDQEITVYYAINVYTVTFMYEGQVWATVTYEHGQTEITAPVVPTRRGYTVAWETYTLNNTSFTVNAVETIITYYATFMADGVQVGERVPFTVTDQSIAEPAVPDKYDYRGVWETYLLPYFHTEEPTDITINAVYTRSHYYVTFKKTDGTVIGQPVRFEPNVTDPSTLVLPNLSVEDYDYTLSAEPDWTKAEDQEIIVTYTLTTYTITFVDKATGAQIGEKLTFIPNVTDFADFDLTFLNKADYDHSFAAPDLTQKRDLTVEVTYTLTTYTITFVDKATGTQIGEKLTFIPNVTDFASFDLTFLNKADYDHSFAAPDLTQKRDLTVEVTYTLTTYTITFVDATTKLPIGTPLTFIPNVTNFADFDLSFLNKADYDHSFAAPDLTQKKNLTVEVTYTLTTYTITFVDATTKLPIGTPLTFIPNVTDFASFNLAFLAREGFNYTFAAPDLTKKQNLTVEVTYTLKTYTVTFVYGNQSWPVTYEHGQTEITAPAVPTRRGYTVAWETYTLNNTSFTVNAVETINTYYAIFMIGEQEIARVPFTVETQAITAPAVPAKTGYTGLWSAYVLPFYHTDEPTDLTITAQYTANVYTATFMADGKVVATVQFTVEDTSLAEPTVPAKAGYTGAWETYTIGAADMTINAVYTLIPTSTQPVEPGEDTDKPADTPDEEPAESKAWILWVIIAILCVIVAALVVFLVWKNKKNDGDDDNTPPTAPVPAPETEAEPEEEASAETETNAKADVELAADVEAEVEAKAETAAEASVAEAPAPAPAPIRVTVLTATSRAIVNLSQLDAYFEAGESVTLEILQAKKLVSKKESRLKILAGGALTKPLNVVADYYSGSAKAMIEAAGGTATQK